MGDDSGKVKPAADLRSASDGLRFPAGPNPLAVGGRHRRRISRFLITITSALFTHRTIARASCYDHEPGRQVQLTARDEVLLLLISVERRPIGGRMPQLFSMVTLLNHACVLCLGRTSLFSLCLRALTFRSDDRYDRREEESFRRQQYSMFRDRK